MMEAHVTVDHWINTYLVAGNQTSSRTAHAMLDVRSRLDLRVTEELAASCSQWLPLRLDPASPAVWRIRKLDLHFTVDLALPASVNDTERWGERVAGRIAEVIDRGPNDDGVICFRSRPAYLAQFTLDLLSGGAWNKWYYDEFRSLALLGAGRALAEAFTAEPEQGWFALLELAGSGRFDEMLASLSEADASFIIERCCAGSQTSSTSTQELSRWCGQLLEVWSGEPLRPGIDKATHRDALRWHALAGLRFPGAEQDGTARAAVAALLDLRRVLAAFASPLTADRLVRRLVERSLSLDEAIATAGRHGVSFPDSGLRFLLQVSGGDSHWAAEMTQVLLRDQQPGAASAFSCDSFVTSFGGVFLLCRDLSNLTLGELTQAAADGQQNADAAAFLRHLVLAKCLGAADEPEAMQDPALRLLAGYDGPCVSAEAAVFEPAALLRAQKVFIKALSAPFCLLAYIAGLPSTGLEALVVQDAVSGAWIYTQTPPPADPTQALLTAINLVHESTGSLPTLLLHGGLVKLADSPGLQQTVERLVPLNEEPFVEGLVAISAEKVSQFVSDTERDLPYLTCRSGTDAFKVDAQVDLFSAMVAHAALKAFARRLMGFQSSSPEHLGRNFLRGLSTVRCLPDRIEVNLPRSPLSLVLQFSGLLRQNYSVPWLQEREVWLLPPQD